MRIRAKIPLWPLAISAALLALSACASVSVSSGGSAPASVESTPQQGSNATDTSMQSCSSGKHCAP